MYMLDWSRGEKGEACPQILGKSTVQEEQSRTQPETTKHPPHSGLSVLQILEERGHLILQIV